MSRDDVDSRFDGHYEKAPNVKLTTCYTSDRLPNSRGSLQSSSDALGSKNKTGPMPKKKESQILLSQNQALFEKAIYLKIVN